jgi:type III secretory pathway component EscT
VAALLILGTWPFRELAMIPVGVLIGFAFARLHLAVEAIQSIVDRTRRIRPPADDDLA